MMQVEMKRFELEMKERRITHWQKYHKLPGCREMNTYFENVVIIV